jgi:cytochrome P450
MTTKPIVYRDVEIPGNSMVFFPVSIAGRDPAAVDDPDRFDPDRMQTNKHLAFGRGAHICLGQFIARAQIEEALHLIAQRIKNPQRAGQSAWRNFFGVWGMRGLPITHEGASAHGVRS